MTKGGLVSDFSPWRGRWGVYWRIKQWIPRNPVYGRLALKFAEKYPQTWEVRLILFKKFQEEKHVKFVDELDAADNNEQENQ